jgi:hypothetical protein
LTSFPQQALKRAVRQIMGRRRPAAAPGSGMPVETPTAYHGRCPPPPERPARIRGAEERPPSFPSCCEAGE